MKQIPGYFLPEYSEEARRSALFHYTSAAGLLGIFRTGTLWCTATHCSNDESELAVGVDLLSGIFKSVVQDLRNSEDKLIFTFLSRGINPYDYADSFTDLIVGMVFNKMAAYISCFCQAGDEEVFIHGLLSQWRGYGQDGGYAIQFNWERLAECISKINERGSNLYRINEVFYSKENIFKRTVIEFKPKFQEQFLIYLKSMEEIFNDDRSIPNFASALTGGPLESFLQYLIYTKNHHFNEEKEVRLSTLCGYKPPADGGGSGYFIRNGIIVPYKEVKLPETGLLDCIDGILIGPGPRMAARYESVRHLVYSTGKIIPIRASRIPFSRQ